MNYSTNNDGNLVLTFDSNINIDNQYTNTSIGVKVSTMELFKDVEGVPNGIEWDVNDGEFVEFIGLWFEGKNLIDYDGVFELPIQAIKLIRKSGYKVAKDF